MDNVLTVEQVFAERLLTVPDYQRGYSWENRQLAEFVEDLELLGVGKDHYTGTVILHPQPSPRLRDAAGRSYAVVNIVDGQQRLTTIVLLLNAIRGELAELGHAELADGISSAYVSTRGLDGRPLYKLTLNRDSNEFFVRSVLSEKDNIDPPAIQAHRRLANADAFFCNYLEDQRNQRDDYNGWLLELFDKVTNQLKVTLYTVSEQSEVGVIFETMNDRGKPLTDLEKVKNFLLYAASRLDIGGAELAEAVNASWTDILENLMRAHLTVSSEEDRFLRAHWLMSHDPQSQHWVGSKSIKDRFHFRRYENEQDRLRNELYEYAETLRAASRAYCEVVEPRHHDAFRNFTDERKRSEVVDWTEKLRRTRQPASFIPLLIAARLRAPEDPDVFLQIVQLCERFAFRVYLLQRSPSHSGQTRLFKLANSLYKGQVKPAHVVTELRRLLLTYSRNFEAAIQFDPDTNWYEWAGIKYFLYEYEEFLTRDRAPRMSWDELDRRDKQKTIEHILPQTPDDAYWQERFTAEERQHLTHDLGNLALTQDNSSYGNKDFPNKRGRQGLERPDGKRAACYANSMLVQETDLVGYEDWTPKELHHRRDKLVAWALQRWHADPAEPLEIEPEEEEDVQETPAVKTGLLAQGDYETEGPRSTRRRGAGAWTWDDYYKHSAHSPAKIDRVRELTERIAIFAPQPPTTSVNQQVFRVGKKQRVCALAFWGDSIIIAAFGVREEPVPNPWPDLKNKKSPDGWVWYVGQNDELPRDLSFLQERFDLAASQGSV